MSRHAKVVATYCLSEFEKVQAVVSVETSYPDALAEARATALAVVKGMVDDAYSRERVADPEPDTAA